MSDSSGTVWMGCSSQTWIRQFFYARDSETNERDAKAWASEHVDERRWIQKLQPVGDCYSVKAHQPETVYTLTKEPTP